MSVAVREFTKVALSNLVAGDIVGIVKYTDHLDPVYFSATIQKIENGFWMSNMQYFDPYGRGSIGKSCYKIIPQWVVEEAMEASSKAKPLPVSPRILELFTELNAYGLSSVRQARDYVAVRESNEVADAAYLEDIHWIAGEFVSKYMDLIPSMPARSDIVSAYLTSKNR